MAKCPYCEKQVTLEKNNPDQVKREQVGWLTNQVMYSCPHCEKVLGFASTFNA